jgi:hypothetical protein
MVMPKVERRKCCSGDFLIRLWVRSAVGGKKGIRRRKKIPSKAPSTTIHHDDDDDDETGGSDDIEESR